MGGGCFFVKPTLMSYFFLLEQKAFLPGYGSLGVIPSVLL